MGWLHSADRLPLATATRSYILHTICTAKIEKCNPKFPKMEITRLRPTSDMNKDAGGGEVSSHGRALGPPSLPGLQGPPTAAGFGLAPPSGPGERSLSACCWLDRNRKSPLVSVQSVREMKETWIDGAQEELLEKETREIPAIVEWENEERGERGPSNLIGHISARRIGAEGVWWKREGGGLEPTEEWEWG